MASASAVVTLQPIDSIQFTSANVETDSSATPSAPVPPTGVAASDGTVKGLVRVTWESAPDAESYEVWRNVSNDFSSAVLLEENVSGKTSYDDLTASFDTGYYYWVRSKNSLGTSSESNSGFGRQNFALWAFKGKGTIYSSPATGPDGAFYFGTRDFTNAQRGTLYAVDRNGVQQWEFASGAILGSPAVHSDGTIYFGSLDGNLYALNRDGTEKWEFKTSGTMSAAPAISGDGTVYVCAGDQKLYALNPDGTKFWEQQIDPPRSASFGIGPVIGLDGTVYAGSSSGTFYAFNPDKTIKWMFRASSAISSSASIASDGTIYFGSILGRVYALSPAGGKKWEFAARGQISAFPIIGADGVVYVTTQGNKLYAINPDGTEKWDAALPGTSDCSVALGADNLIYAASGFGIFGFDNRGTNLWTVRELSGVSGSSPMLAQDGTLYVGTLSGNFYALKTGGAGLANSSWPVAFHDLRHSGNLAPPSEPPVLPSGLGASSGNYVGDVRIRWDYDGAAKIFEIWRGTNSVLANASLIASNLTGTAYYDDRSVLPGTTNYYWVRITTRLGTSPFSDALAGFAASETEAWEAALPSGIATGVALAPDQTAYVGGSDGVLYAITQGGVKWSYPTGNRILNPPAIGPDGTLYMVFTDLYALNPDGTVKWRSNTNVFDFAAPSLAADGTIYCANDKLLLAFNSEGKLQWRFETGGTIYSAPASGRDGTLYLPSSDGIFYAVNPDGTERWRYALNTPNPVAPAIDADGTIYVCSQDKHLFALNPDGTLKWKADTATVANGAPTIGANGNIYVGATALPVLLDTNHNPKFPLYAISPDGTRRWEYLAGALPSGPAQADDGTLYTGNSNGLTALNADGTERWTFLSDTNSVGTPAIGTDGKVYFASGKKVYAIQAGTKLAESAWPSYRGNAQLAGRVSESARVLLRVTEIRLGEGNQLKVGIRGNPGKKVMVQASTDLVNWVDLSIVISMDSGTYQFNIERIGSEGKMFYRVVER